MTENRWTPFTDDEVGALFEAMGEMYAETPSDHLFDELRDELQRRRPDDPRLLTVLGRSSHGGGGDA
jgi:hypothetical protein